MTDQGRMIETQLAFMSNAATDLSLPPAPWLITMHKPGYWMNEVTGVLRPAVEAFCNDEPMTARQIAAMRTYLRQWIAAPLWQGPVIDELRRSVDCLKSATAIREWLMMAVREGVDPL
jgi:hypothetical protein